MSVERNLLVHGRVEVGVVELATEAPDQRHEPPARVRSPAEDVARAPAGVLDRLGVGLVLVPGGRRLEAELVVDVGPVPQDHRLGRQRQAEGLSVELAVVLLPLLEVGDVIIRRRRDALVEGLHHAGGAIRREERVVELGNVILSLSLLDGQEQLLVRLAVGYLGHVDGDAGLLGEGRDERLDGRRGRAWNEEYVDLVRGCGRTERRCQHRGPEQTRCRLHESSPCSRIVGRSRGIGAVGSVFARPFATKVRKLSTILSKGPTKSPLEKVSFTAEYDGNHPQVRAKS
jgi:hypothetical protein